MRSRRQVVLLVAAALAALLLGLLLARRGALPHAAEHAAASAAGAPLAALAPPPSRLPLRLAAPLGEAAPAAIAGGLARFQGRVVDARTGAGVGGAEVTFSLGGAASTVRTGVDGGFAFEAGAAGRWLLAAATAPGYLPFAPEWGHSPVQLVAEPGRDVKGIELHLAPASELEGRVVTGEGAPAPGADVRLLGAGGEAALIGLADRFRADARGAFRAAAPEGSVLEARLEGYAPGRAAVDVLALVNGRITVSLGPRTAGPAPARAALRGRVVARGGAPVAGALVVATPAGGTGPARVPAEQASTGADGRFALTELDPGPHELVARAEGRAPGRARGDAGAPGEVVIELGEGGRLRGCVRDTRTGTPVVPFTIQVFERRNALWLAPERALSVIDPSGCYALDDLRPARLVAIFSAPGRAASAALPVEIPAPPAAAVLDAELEAGGTLTGDVRDEASGAPIAGARISVEGDLSAAASTFPVLSEAITATDGTFTLAALPRHFSVLAAAAGYHARVAGGLGAEPGQAAGPVELRLRPLGPGEDPAIDLVGIGAGLAAQEDGLLVTRVVPGGGAAELGIVPGDVILSVNGQPVTDLGMGGAVDLIRGPEGTFVVLQLRRGGATLELHVPRRAIRG